MTTPNLDLPELTAAQAQPHVNLNTSLRILDAIVQLNVIDMTLAEPDTSVSEGACYIVGDTPTGIWAGQAKKIAAYIGGDWRFITPRAGWRLFNQFDGLFYYWSEDEADWVEEAQGGGGSGSPVSPESYPIAPTAADDEFEYGATIDTTGARATGANAWSWYNKGSSTGPHTRGALKLTVPTEATGNIRGVEQTLTGDLTWRYEARLANPASASNTLRTGMAIRENSSSKVLLLSRGYVSSARNWQVSYWTSATALSSSLFSADYSSFMSWMGWNYFAIYKTSTKYGFEVSADGIGWLLLAEPNIASYFTADRIGLYGFNGNTFIPLWTVCDWFRRVA